VHSNLNLSPSQIPIQIKKSVRLANIHKNANVLFNIPSFDSWFFILPIQQRVGCRSVGCLGKEEKLVFAFFGIIVAAIGAWLSFDYFTENGVNPDLAAGYVVAIFALILGAFGLIAVRVYL